MKRTYLVEFSRTEIDENGHRVPVLPWARLPVVARFSAAVDKDGQYAPAWLVAVVAADEKTHEQIAQSAGVTILPDGKSEEPLGAKPVGERTELLTKVATLGVDASRITTETPQKDVLDVLGKTLRRSFVAEAFDVGDPFETVRA